MNLTKDHRKKTHKDKCPYGFIEGIGDRLEGLDKKPKFFGERIFARGQICQINQELSSSFDEKKEQREARTGFRQGNGNRQKINQGVDGNRHRPVTKINDFDFSNCRHVLDTTEWFYAARFQNQSKRENRIPEKPWMCQASAGAGRRVCLRPK